MKLLFAAFVCLFLIGAVFAHPSDSLNPEVKRRAYFRATGTVLTVRIFHPVKTPANHFITSVIVGINGKEAVKQSYSSQLNKNEQTAIYKIIDAKKEDKINVSAQCNIAGKKKETLIYTFTK